MSAADIAGLLEGTEVSRGVVRRAAIHLPKPLRAALYDAKSPQHRTASGEFFEALVYELLLKAGEESPSVLSIASKFSDALYVPYDKYSKDGLWYSKDGGIRFKVAGRVAAEVDFLVKTADEIRVFGEVVVNPASAQTLGSEISKKRALLERLYGGIFQCVVVCAKPMQELRFLEEDDATAVVLDGEQQYQRIHENEILHKKSAPAASSKRVDGRDF